MKSIKLTHAAALGGAHKLASAATAHAAVAHRAVASAQTAGAAYESTPIHLGASASAHHVSGGGGSPILRTIVALVLVIVVIYGIAWILKRVKKSRDGRASGAGLAPIATMPLGAGRSVQLVRAGQELLLLGVAEQGVTTLRSYTEAEAIAAGFELPGSNLVWEDPAQIEQGGVVNALRRLTVRT